MNRVKLYSKAQEVSVLWKTFPGGELHPFVQRCDDHLEKCVIYAAIQNSDDIMKMLLLTNAVKEMYLGIKVTLVMPYIPYARQDRISNDGESFSLKVFSRLVNAQGYHKVISYDPHSDVSLALIDNLKPVSQVYFVSGIPLTRANTVLVSPDAGACKKTFEAAMRCEFDGAVYASKHRDTTTGQITGTTVDCDHIGDKDFLIIDDICDGGRTFIELAKKLTPKTNGKIYLYVTHGIFSNGLAELSQYIDMIYTVNPFASAISDTYVTVLNHEEWKNES